jgi:phosphohistidine phosphatase SixA
MFKSFKKLLIVSVMLTAVGFLVACETMIHSPKGTTTTVIMIRHADRTPSGSELTERGHKNAKELVNEIGDMDIAVIYSPDLVRNLDTVKPLANHLGIEIIKVQDDPVPQDVVLTIMEKYPGKTVLWVGNTTNLPGIYYLLGGEGEPPVKYGDLFILAVPDEGQTNVTKKKWGDNK